MLTTVSSADLREDPSAKLWALIFYLAEHPTAQSDKDLRALHLAFTYDAEVKNGGHLQYFQNHGSREAPATIDALTHIGATTQANLLCQALSQLESSPIKWAKSLQEYSELANQGPMDRLDDDYYRSKPEVLDLLERFIEPRIDSLVGVKHDG